MERGKRKKVYSGLLDKSISFSIGDIIEQKETVRYLRKALVKVFPPCLQVYEGRGRLTLLQNASAWEMNNPAAHRGVVQQF